MKTYTVKSNRNIQLRKLLMFKGETQTVQYDFSPWEADNGSVTSVVWTLKGGQVGISGEALLSSIASALITTSQSGGSMITITATSGNNVLVTYLEVRCKDPYALTEDYGFTSVNNG